MKIAKAHIGERPNPVRSWLMVVLKIDDKEFVSAKYKKDFAENGKGSRDKMNRYCLCFKAYSPNRVEMADAAIAM